MLFSSCQLRAIVYALFVTFSIGQESFRECDHDYCYERSAERRSPDKNNLRISHHFRNDDLEREHQREYQGINEIDGRHVDRELRWTSQLPDETHRHTNSDVTRHLNDKSDERRNKQVIGRLDANFKERHSSRQLSDNDDTTQSFETLRHFNRRHIERSSQGNREEHRQLLEHVDPRLTESMRLKDNRDERNEDIRQINERNIGRRSNIVRPSDRISQGERELIVQELETRGTFKCLADQEHQREVSRHSELDHQERRDIAASARCDINERSKRTNQFRDEIVAERDIRRRDVNRSSDRGLKSENERERVDDRKIQEYKTRHLENNQEKLRTDQRNIDRYLENKREKHHDTLRLLEVNPDSRRRIERISLNEHESMHRRDENNRERESNVEYSRKQRDVNVSLKENYTVRDDNRRAEDTSSSLKRHEERKWESNHSDDNPNSQRIIERIPLKERKSMQGHDENKQGRVRHFDDLENQKFLSRYLDATRESECKIEHVLDREYESRQRRSENEQDRTQRQETLEIDERENRINRLKRFETTRRIENRDVQYNDNIRLEDKREEHRDTLRRYDDREVRHLVSRQLVDTRDKRFDDHLSRRQQESLQHLDKNSRTRVELLLERNDVRERVATRSERNDVRRTQRDLRNIVENGHHDSLERFDDGDSQRDRNKRLDGTRSDDYQISRQEYQIQRSDVARNTQRTNRQISRSMSESIQVRKENKQERHDILRLLDEHKAQRASIIRFEDIRESVRKDKQLKERNAMRRLDDSRNFDRRFYQLERDTDRTFIFNQKNNIANHRNERLIVPDYPDYPTIFIKRSSLVLGQGVILAYVIMKTFNGQNVLKNQLHIGIRETAEMIGF